jgi:hypothetical protein
VNTIETGPSNNARDSEVWSLSWTLNRYFVAAPRHDDKEAEILVFEVE